MKIVPCYKYLLCKAVNKKPKTEGGIILPDNVLSQTDCGEVVSIGGDCLDTSYEVGDVVYFRCQTALAVRGMNGEALYFVKKDEVEGYLKVN